MDPVILIVVAIAGVLGGGYLCYRYGKYVQAKIEKTVGKKF